MKIEKTITVQIVDTKWIITIKQGTEETTKIFSLAAQFEAYLKKAVELEPQ